MRRSWLTTCLVAACALVGASLGRAGRDARAEDATAGPAYVGSRSCKACHVKHLNSWSATDMAKTFEALKPGQAAEKKKAAKLDPNADFTKDAGCLKCHTTGYGTESGYPAVEAGKEPTPAQAERMKSNEGVTCEACHGAGSLYVALKKEKAKADQNYKRDEILRLGIVSPPQAETCAPCHAPGGCPTMPADYAFRFDVKSKEQGKIHEHVALKKPH